MTKWGKLQAIGLALGALAWLLYLGVWYSTRPAQARRDEAPIPGTAWKLSECLGCHAAYDPQQFDLRSKRIVP